MGRSSWRSRAGDSAKAASPARRRAGRSAAGSAASARVRRGTKVDADGREGGRCGGTRSVQPASARSAAAASTTEGSAGVGADDDADGGGGGGPDAVGAGGGRFRGLLRCRNTIADRRYH